MHYASYVEPKHVHGFEMYRAYITVNGTPVWECFRWSENEARTQVLRQLRKLGAT